MIYIDSHQIRMTKVFADAIEPFLTPIFIDKNLNQIDREHDRIDPDRNRLQRCDVNYRCSVLFQSQNYNCYFFSLKGSDYAYIDLSTDGYPYLPWFHGSSGGKSDIWKYYDGFLISNGVQAGDMLDLCPAWDSSFNDERKKYIDQKLEEFSSTGIKTDRLADIRILGDNIRQFENNIYFMNLLEEHNNYSNILKKQKVKNRIKKEIGWDISEYSLFCHIHKIFIYNFHDNSMFFWLLCLDKIISKRGLSVPEYLKKVGKTPITNADDLSEILPLYLVDGARRTGAHSHDFSFHAREKGEIEQTLHHLRGVMRQHEYSTREGTNTAIVWDDTRQMQINGLDNALKRPDWWPETFGRTHIEFWSDRIKLRKRGESQGPDDEALAIGGDTPSPEYSGETNANGLAHGKGVYKFANGDIYDGNWKDGKASGKGVLKFANGAIYDGNWKDGKQSGKGILKYANGAIYDGNWKDGKRSGEGVLNYADGITTYDGNWKDDKLNGKGVYKYDNGAIYDGNWKDDKKSGKGILKYAEERDELIFWGVVEYSGTFQDNFLDGKGMCRRFNGETYVGEWRNGVPHGQGTYTFVDGKTYEGVWVDNENDEFWDLAEDLIEKSPRSKEEDARLSEELAALLDGLND